MAWWRRARTDGRTEGRKPGRASQLLVLCFVRTLFSSKSNFTPTPTLSGFVWVFVSLAQNALSLPARLLCVTCPSIPPPLPPPPINFIPGETSFGGESQLGLRKGARACLARCSAYSFAIQHGDFGFGSGQSAGADARALFNSLDADGLAMRKRRKYNCCS